MNRVKITQYGYERNDDFNAKQIKAISDEIAKEIKKEFPNKDEERIAEIALTACTRLLIELSRNQLL